MTIHIVGLRPPAELRLKTMTEFISVAERRAVGDGNDAQICCQLGGSPRSRAECRECPRFLAWDGDSDELRVRCRWTHRDLVRDCMTYIGALTVTRPDATCDEAEQLRQRSDAHELLVVDGVFLVGIVSECALRDGGPTPVRERMIAEPFAIRATASVGEALAAMALLGVGALPVVSHGYLVGLLTRRNLAEIGVPPTLLGSVRPLPLTLSEAHRMLG
jgi:CBS domain-containing protein